MPLATHSEMHSYRLESGVGQPAQACRSPRSAPITTMSPRAIGRRRSAAIGALAALLPITLRNGVEADAVRWWNWASSSPLS